MCALALLEQCDAVISNSECHIGDQGSGGRVGRPKPRRRHDLMAGQLEIGDAVIGRDLLQPTSDFIGNATRRSRKPHSHRGCIGEAQHHDCHAAIDLGVKRGRVDAAQTQVGHKAPRNTLVSGGLLDDRPMLMRRRGTRWIGHTECHHIGDCPNEVVATRCVRRVLQPDGADHLIAPAHRHGKQRLGAECIQDLVKFCRTTIPRSIRDLDLLTRQQMGEQCRQLVMVQLQALDVPAGLAVKAVLTAQDPPAVRKPPNAGPSGMGHLGQRLRQRS